MGLPQIVDQVALRAAAVSGIAAASGAGVTAGVAGMPIEPPGYPFAMCIPGSATTEQSRVTTTDDEVMVRVYVPASSLPAGGSILMGFPDLFETAWRSDRDLGGACLDSWYAGHDPIEREQWNEIWHLVLPIRIGILRIVTGTLTS